MNQMKTKAWVAVAVVFSAGALAVNAVWVHFYNVVDQRHVESYDEIVRIYDSRIADIRNAHELKITRLENTHKRAMGEMRNRVERKVDRVLEKLNQMPPTPIVIDARTEAERVKIDD